MLRPWKMSCLAATLLLPLLSGCVKKSTHESLLMDLSRLQQEQAAERSDTREDVERREAIEAGLRGELARTEAELERLEALFEEARTEVHRLDLILSERGAEYRQLQDRVQRLSAIEREVRQRNEIYEEVIGRFRSLIDGGRLSVAVVRGRMTIQLPQDILFESGSAVIASDGRRTLAEVGAVLADFEDRIFQVEGHTDNVPISTARFSSNWELSAARALSVVQLLVQGGVRADHLSGAAFGEFQPVAPNTDREGRRLNRRIEIVMLPNLDVISQAELPE